MAITVLKMATSSAGAQFHAADFPEIARGSSMN
jgi:hypothetical protein